MREYKNKIILLLALLLFGSNLYSQNSIIIDTALIKFFLQWRFSILYPTQDKIICDKPLKINNIIFDCGPDRYINGRKIVHFEKAILCNYLDSEDIKFMQQQYNAINNINSFTSVIDTQKFCNCDTISTKEVTDEFSIPLFSKNKKTVLLYNDAGISNTGCSSYRIQLYKMDDKGNWNYFHTLFRFETD